MADSLTQETGLLRKLAPHVVKEIIPVDPDVQAYMRTHGLTVPPSGAGDRTNIQPAGRGLFQQLSECIFGHSPAMERGTQFASIQTELLGFIGAYAGRNPASITHVDAERLRDHFLEWFSKRADVRRVFVPCLLSRWQAKDFAIGPVSFFFVGEKGFHTFYT